MFDRFKIRSAIICVALSLSVLSCWSAETSVSDLRREIEDLRKQMAAANSGEVIQQQIENRVANVLNVDTPVQTRSGKLRIGGLLQVWAYSIQNDSRGLADGPQIQVGPEGTAARNQEADNDSFRVRRAEIRFALDIHENISAFITIDPAREATAFPSFPSNQGSAKTGDHDAYFFDPCLCEGFIDDPRQIGPGIGTGNRMLEEAYINYHDAIPFHDVSVGQFKRRLGDEGTRDSSELDFVERSMMTQPADLRDLGIQVHGNFLDGRLQYWAGLFNGAGTAFQSRGNRSDDNDEKDAVFAVLARPVNNHERFGTLEVGYSIMLGLGGENARHNPGDNPINALNRRSLVHSLQYAWGNYRPAGSLQGWWLHGEWGQYRDRFAPNEAASGLDVFSSNPGPFEVQGWNVSTGYHLGELADTKLPNALRKLEFLFRYDVMQNLFFHDLVVPERRFDVFKTQVYTAGANYYVSGNNVKLQLNYNWVLEEDNVDKEDRQLREVKNNSLVLNLQVAF